MLLINISREIKRVIEDLEKMIDLYTYYRSSCSYRVRIALNFKGLDYRSLPIHLVKDGGEQYKKEYTDLNPRSEVPTIVDENIALSQSVAIFFYLDRKHLNPSLFPKPFPEFERCIELIEIINSGTQPLQNVSVLQKLVKEHGFTEDEKSNWCKHYITKGLLAYQKKITEGASFSIGEEPTAADMFLVPQLYNAKRHGVDLELIKPLMTIGENCNKIVAFKNAAPELQADAPKEP